MKILAILPMGALPNPPLRHRATLSIRFDKHTIKDWETGKEFILDPVEAWEKFNELNGVRPR